MRRVSTLLLAFAGFSLSSTVTLADLTGIYAGKSGGPVTYLQLFEQDGQVTGNLTGGEFGTFSGQTGADGIAAGNLEMGLPGPIPVEIRKSWAGVVLTIVAPQQRIDLPFFHEPRSEVDSEIVHRYWILSEIPFNRLSIPEIRQRLETGILHGNTLVFSVGMSDWMPLANIPELAALMPKTARASVAPAELVGADDPLRALLVSTLIEQIVLFTPNQREAVVICAFDVFSVLDPADHDLLVQTRMNLSDEQQADFEARNPGLFDKIYACADPTVVLGEQRSSIELLDGRVFSVRGPGVHSIDIVGINPVFTVGTTTISYADDVLTVDGTPMDIPAFSKSLEVDIAADGTASLVVDP